MQVIRTISWLACVRPPPAPPLTYHYGHRRAVRRNGQTEIFPDAAEQDFGCVRFLLQAHGPFHID